MELMANNNSITLVDTVGGQCQSVSASGCSQNNESGSP